MSDKTGIEWTDATWNPVTGCTEVSPGCDHCYAKTFAERWRGTPGHYYERGFDVELRPEKLDQPLRWKRPRRIFVNSMSDLFHDQVSDEYIVDVWAVMVLAGRHTFQVLTKRHGRMRSLLNERAFWDAVGGKVNRLYDSGLGEHPGWSWTREFDREANVPRNVWLGVSAENQQWADIRIPALLDTPAAVRFVSAEPLLGPIDLYHSHCPEHDFAGGMCTFSCPQRRRVDWVIAGGESGHGARPMHPDWAHGLRDQCRTTGIAFLFKQHGEYQPLPYANDDGADLYVERSTGRTATDDDMWNISSGHWWGVRRVGKKAAGRELDGRTWDEYPEAGIV